MPLVPQLPDVSPLSHFLLWTECKVQKREYKECDIAENITLRILGVSLWGKQVGDDTAAPQGAGLRHIRLTEDTMEERQLYMWSAQASLQVYGRSTA